MVTLERTTGKELERPRRWRRSWIFLLVVGCLLPVAADAGSGAMDPGAAPAITFDRHEIVTGAANSQTIVPGFFFGGAFADLAVVSIDESESRLLRVYSLADESWVQRLEMELSPHPLFVDAVGVDGRDRLIVWEGRRLSWLDPGSAKLRPLLDIPSSGRGRARSTPSSAEAVGPPRPGWVPHVDISRDLNGDGRDDLVVPEIDGFWVMVQLDRGAFAEPMRFGPPEPFRDAVALDEKRSYGDIGITARTLPWYLGRLHVMDYDQDGRNDLLFWNEDHFDVHLQGERGLFRQAAETLVVDAPFDSDGPYSLMFGYRDASTLSLALGLRKKSSRTALHSIRDVNADGVADLVTLTLSGRSLLRQRARYDLYYGVAEPAGVRFARRVSASIQSPARTPPGYSYEWLLDVDGDGRVDIVRGHVKTGVGRMIGALVGGTISLGFEIYRFDDESLLDGAAAKRKVKADLGVRGGPEAAFFPAVLVGDVNGDGRSDLLVGGSRDELHVFLGESGPSLLAQESRVVEVEMPGSERNTWLADLNRDGKQDLLMHHPSATGPHRLTMLIAR